MAVNAAFCGPRAFVLTQSMPRIRRRSHTSNEDVPARDRSHPVHDQYGGHQFRSAGRGLAGRKHSRRGFAATVLLIVLKARYPEANREHQGAAASLPQGGGPVPALE